MTALLLVLAVLAVLASWVVLAYNGLVAARKRRFPTAVVAGLGDFPDRAYFELDTRATRGAR